MDQLDQTTAFHAGRIFDGAHWHEDAALLVAKGRVTGILPSRRAPAGPEVAGWIVPGLVDLQVNGGGGMLFNNEPTPQGIARICAAHAGLGTTALMVTLITDRPEVTTSAIAAAKAARGTPGLLGLHLEGPHLAPARKGTHDPALIRPMRPEDLAELLGAARDLPLICTLAPEAADAAAIAALAAAGARVSLGHSDCTSAEALAAAEAGARMVTHLFNAMSPLSHRAPGLVGAALDDGRLSCGLIADGFHVDDMALRIALRAKAGPGRLFLVSDAMATVGGALTEFTLNGRRILRGQGRLTLVNGTLAGADIAQIDGLRHLVRAVGVDPAEALRMAALYPAEAMGSADRGHLRPGARADFLHLSPDLRPLGTWIGGRRHDPGAEPPHPG